MLLRIVIVFAIILIFEFFAYRAFLKLFINKGASKIFKRIYLTILFGIIVFTLIYYTVLQFINLPDYIQFRKFFNITGIFLLNFIPKVILLVFSIIDDLIILYLKVFHRKNRKTLLAFRKAWIFSGLVLAAFMFLAVIHGMVWGKSNFKVEQITISSERLPEAFDGFTIAHISDLHLGSFKNDKILKKGISLLMQEHPDLIVLTGDIVNNEAVEFEIYSEVLSELYAPHGIYSILGNHDMGDYRRWYNEREKNCNLKQLIIMQELIGWHVLLNTHDYLVIEEDSIAIIGVKNWGLPPFNTYGDLSEAIKGIPHDIFSILLSHDPSHWMGEVVGATPIDLTLSGHTHGFQFGFQTESFQISPVQLKYKKWAGLYKTNNQSLYINRGFGYIGFAGRVGIWPEITIITLEKI